ncbi:MAG: hypothetical protein V4721_03270 [Bacteroidota bacterium]
MPHIFQFHKGTNQNILDWTASNRIKPGDVRDVMDRTNILTSSAGTSIPTPLARMHLFKTAFEIMAVQVRDNSVENKSIYAGLVSEVLDLLELLYKSGNDRQRFRFQKWTFDNTTQDDNILSFFGSHKGHRLLSESFKQAASQAPFNNKIEITLIYLKEGINEVLIGGTSPFTMVFTSPNFKRKMGNRGIRKINGLISNDILFDTDYKLLQERDESFIQYIESIKNTPTTTDSLEGFKEYITNTGKRFESSFHGSLGNLKDIQVGDNPLTVTGVHFKQINEAEYKQSIENYSDFKIELPAGTNYTGVFPPLFLLDRMPYDGQYTSPTSSWSDKTRVSELEYPYVDPAELENRELPGIDGFTYPFLSSFDFFERCLVTFDGYTLNSERFVTLVNNQPFALPIKPIFFHFFPLNLLKDYLTVEIGEDAITFIIKIPVVGPTKGRRVFVSKKVYDQKSTLKYSGILGIFPFTKAVDKALLHTNKYTVAAYEKTKAVNDPVNYISFYKKNGIDRVPSEPVSRSVYQTFNTKSSYYQVSQSFDLIQANFLKDNSNCGSVIIPKFREVYNGAEEYVYAIDFGTSNTHVEYSHVVDESARKTEPFEIGEQNMQMTLLNTPYSREENDGALIFNDYEFMGTSIDGSRQIVLREFVPFQLGAQRGATFKFPFRTATFESRGFKDTKNPLLFSHLNIGFSIEKDAIDDNSNYQTDIKWQLESRLNDDQKQHRVNLFFRQLILMIRTHALLINNPTANIDKVKIAMSFPVSMDADLRKYLLDRFQTQFKDLFDFEGDISKRAIEVTESIAPYYYLLKEDANIQHDVYCNIDVGGGTSDIILVKKDSTLLNCYCTSVKFAGKQLWGSASDDFNPDDNGFLFFYKSFLQSKDKETYLKVKKIFEGRTTRTEDIVSFLFGKEEHKFKQIFTECRELKVPLLIHYASLLYFVSKLAKIHKIELPKTISFSGKGSEYISIVFGNDEHLRQFTQKALSIFSGLDSNASFKIKKSRDPKVITAKGAVIYAAKPLVNLEEDIFNSSNGNSDGNGDDLQIKPSIFVYSGLDESHDISAFTYKDFDDPGELYGKVLNANVELLDTFFSNQELIAGSEKALGINNLSKFKSFFIPADIAALMKGGVLRNSYKSALQTKTMSSKVEDSPFFFAFRTSLIELSKTIAETALKIKN